LFLDEIGELGLDEQAMLLRALESGRFMPLGADREVESDFQLIAGTNREPGEWVKAGRFREDLLARINLWSFELPGLRERREDLSPNLDFELDRFTERTGSRVAFNKEARDTYLAFATQPTSEWRGNFRDLNASVTRMATLAEGGRITSALVDEEIGRLKRGWGAAVARPAGDTLLLKLLGDKGMEQLDRFDRAQLAEVVLACREATSLSEAGRLLFAVSRTQKKTSNDADRLRKYLSRFNLEFQQIKDVEA
jgi:transcriptional regulatory protein RtcR